MTAHVKRCQVCGGYTYTPDANELERMRADTLRALDAAEKYEADEPFAYYSAAIPVAVVTSGNARQVLKLIDRLEAAEAENEAALLNIDNLITERDELRAENERLREQRIIVNRVKRVPDSGFDLLDELDEWKARAEAMEAENERLSSLVVSDGEDVRRLNAEVERLREDFHTQTDSAYHYKARAEAAERKLELVYSYDSNLVDTLERKATR